MPNNKNTQKFIHLGNSWNFMTEMYTELQRFVRLIKERTNSISHSINSSSYYITDQKFEEIFPKRKLSDSKFPEHYNDLKKQLGETLHEEIHEEQSDEDHKHEFGCENESIHIIYKRWHKLEKDILNKDGVFESSKIPDIYDMLKYDMLHNFEFIGDFAEPLFNKIQVLGSIVSPLEFGADPQTKIEIGVCIASPLLQKIHTDLLWWKVPNYQTLHPGF